ncbi:MAG: hypothetical protein E7169_03920 [Firmicutes bacterium]|nr:hypothetical protein [Bacillota bacterium]
MEFFVENWIWFLVAGVVILMTLIGYIAEKTDFGRKDIPKKEKVKKVKEEVIENDELEEVQVKPEVQISLATDSILEDSDVSFEEKIEEPSVDDYKIEEVPEELKVPFGDVSFEEKIEGTSEDMDTQFEGLTFDEPIESMTDVLEENNNSESFVSEVVSEEPVEELSFEKVSEPEIELPDLDSIVSEEVSDDDDDDDDVWKF